MHVDNGANKVLSVGQTLIISIFRQLQIF